MIARLWRGPLLGLFAGAAVLSAQEAPPLAPADPAKPTVLPEATVKALPDGRVQVGQVIIDRAQRTLTFPATINQREGAVEYLLVATRGKIHESVLRTATEPYHVHVAMLLLGAKAATDARPEDFYDLRKKIPGDAVTIEVSWQVEGAAKTFRAESVVQNLQTKKPMSDGAWIYNGSQLLQGSFLAQRDGSFVALITDPGALINNPRPGREDDEIWTANAAVLPPLETPAEVIVRLP